MATKSNGLIVQSVAFSHKGHIPPKYTCEGEDINPSLEISNIPDGAKTLAIIMEDPDAPRGIFDHWLVWNISPNTAIGEKTNLGISGTNSFGKQVMAGHVLLQVRTVTFLKCMHWILNWICWQALIKKLYRKP
jgi:Raf kinase inhibitor-like YbhB/YbcL family protein